MWPPTVNPDAETALSLRQGQISTTFQMRHSTFNPDAHADFILMHVYYDVHLPLAEIQALITHIQELLAAMPCSPDRDLLQSSLSRFKTVIETGEYSQEALLDEIFDYSLWIEDPSNTKDVDHSNADPEDTGPSNPNTGLLNANPSNVNPSNVDSSNLPHMEESLLFQPSQDSSSSDGLDLTLSSPTVCSFGFLQEGALKDALASCVAQSAPFTSSLDSAVGTLVPPSPVSHFGSTAATLVPPSLSTTPKGTHTGLSGDTLFPASHSPPVNLFFPSPEDSSHLSLSSKDSSAAATYHSQRTIACGEGSSELSAHATDLETDDDEQTNKKRKSTTLRSHNSAKRRKIAQHTAGGAGEHPPGAPPPHYTPRKGKNQQLTGVFNNSLQTSNIQAPARNGPQHKSRGTNRRRMQGKRHKRGTLVDEAEEEEDTSAAVPVWSVPPAVSHLLTGIATYCNQSAFPLFGRSINATPAIFDFMNTLVHGKTDVHELFHDNTLANLATRCERSEQLVHVAEFMYLINAVQLAAKLHSSVLQQRQFRHQVIEQMVRDLDVEDVLSETDISTRTKHWERHANNGTRLCLLACAGTFYFLPLLAASGQYPEFVKLTADEVTRLADLLRTPSAPPSLHKAIIDDIIPTLEVMMSHYPIEFESMFSRSSIINTQLPLQLIATELGKTDRYFQQMSYDCFIRTRDSEMWTPCLKNDVDIFGKPRTEPLSLHRINSMFLQWSGRGRTPGSMLLDHPSPLTDVSDLESESESDPLPPPPAAPTAGPASRPTLPDNIIVIKTKYDPKLNTSPCFSRDNPNARYATTQTERTLAEQALAPVNETELGEAICSQLSSGKKRFRSDYTRITPEGTGGKSLLIVDKYGNPIMFLSRTMEEGERDSLLDTVERVYPGVLQTVKSKGQRSVPGAGAVHYYVYNRYSAHGDDVPPDTDPNVAKVSGKRRVSPAQFIPRPSKELRDHRVEWAIIHNALRPVFSWMEVE
ncbi:hypothetical protein BDN72DRAFT_864307, partial [Pluteus cervinus]